MKHLIEGYRRDLKRLDQLARYAKGLEEENLLLQKKLAKIEMWIKEHPYSGELIETLNSEIRGLKNKITKEFPKRVVDLKHLKRKVKEMENHNLYLSSLLTSNGIPYEEQKPSLSPIVEALNIDEINEFAVRGKNENFEVEEQYCYKYPRPAVTAECIVFTKESTPKVLLIERGCDPYKGCWAFPGGFLDMEETTEQCAIRELKEETGLEVMDVRQIGAYSKVDRDPRGRTITVAYLAVVESPIEVKGQDDASKAQWFPIDELPGLAFDHDEIMRDAVECLQDNSNNNQ
jgi:ADP-ribose pyrophosphatase YjhB (NUDIX family)